MPQKDSGLRCVCGQGRGGTQGSLRGWVACPPVGTPGSSFRPSPSAGSSGSGPCGRCWGEWWPRTAFRIPAGGQTEWHGPAKGGCDPQGECRGAEESQETPARLGRGRSGQALQAETACRILGDKQEPDLLGGEGYCGRSLIRGRAQTVRAWASVRERSPVSGHGGVLEAGCRQGVWRGGGSCPAHDQGLCFLPVSSSKPSPPQRLAPQIPGYLPFLFPGGSDGKESAGNAGDADLIPGSGRSPEGGHGHPTPVFLPGQSHGLSCLAG